MISVSKACKIYFTGNTSAVLYYYCKGETYKIYFRQSAYGGYYTMIEGGPAKIFLARTFLDLRTNASFHHGSIWIHSVDGIHRGNENSVTGYIMVDGGLDELVDYVERAIMESIGDNIIER